MVINDMIRNCKIKLLILLLIFIAVSCKKKDEQSPVVTLKGDSFMTIVLNSGFTDPGADATDDIDGIVTVETTGIVDTNFAGTYYIVYTASDAAGNTGETIRTVVVRNEAEIYSGDYLATYFTTNDTSSYLSAIEVSTTINKRLWFGGFSEYQNASVYADISDDTVFFPAQNTQVGFPSVIHKFEGTGLIKNINDTVIFEIIYSDSVSGNIQNGVLVYKKI